MYQICIRDAKMKTFRSALFLIFLCRCMSDNVWGTFDHIRTKSSDKDQAQAVLDLIFRLLPQRAKEFQVVVNSSLSVGGKDVLGFQTVGGQLVVQGNTGVSAAWAFHHYLKYYCKAHISWSGNQLGTIAKPLPVVKKLVKIEVPHR